MYWFSAPPLKHKKIAKLFRNPLMKLLYVFIVRTPIKYRGAAFQRLDYTYM